MTESGPFERLGAFLDTHAEQVLEQLQRAFQSGGTAPPQMTPEQARNVRIPDLGVTCTSIRSDDRLLREPVVLIEILSPSNAADTWGNVWAYTTIPSVHEVLVVHVAEERAELLTRQSDGTWPESPVQLAPGDDVVLASIGFTAPLGVLYP